MSRNVTAQPLIDVERATKIAENAITHMQYCHISAIPNNYRVWFEFFSGDNPELKTKLKSMIESNVDFKGEVNEEIFNRFFGETSHVGEYCTQLVPDIRDYLLSETTSAGRKDSRHLFGTEFLMSRKNNLETGACERKR